jgi:glycosyltransferase involved in cell wall biosynthesis
MGTFGMILGVNAVRARTGGAITHLVNILEFSQPKKYSFDTIHVWCNAKTVQLLPKKDWLIVHPVDFPKTKLLGELLWERFCFPSILRGFGVDILLNVDAGAICRFKKSVSMSRDMLPFEVGIIDQYPLGLRWLRIFMLKIIQRHTLEASEGRIFLTRYAHDTISPLLVSKKATAIIPHGVAQAFKTLGNQLRESSFDTFSNIDCIYVSHFEIYKNQRNVAEAIYNLSQSGFPIKIRFVGGGSGKSKDDTLKYCSTKDPDRKLFEFHDYLNQKDVINLIAKSDVFIFASSCENMPNTVLEGMASGLPIACSNLGPMPEVLKNGGVYFDPGDPKDIEAALLKVISDHKLRNSIVQNALSLSRQYSWHRCSEETMAFLLKVGELNVEN